MSSSPANTTISITCMSGDVAELLVADLNAVGLTNWVRIGELVTFGAPTQEAAAAVIEHAVESGWVTLVQEVA